MSILAQNYYDYYGHQWHTSPDYQNLSWYPNYYYENEINTDYSDYYYEPKYQHQEIQKKTSQENVIISPHPVTQAIKRFFTGLKSTLG